MVAKSVESGIICWFTEIKTFQESTVMEGHGLSQQQENLKAMYHTFKESPVTCVLLLTVQLKIKDCKGNLHTCRVLLDCGSQSNFITESSVRWLGLKQTWNQVPIMGINDATSVTNYNVNLEITSMKNDYTSKLNCLVLPRLTSKMPMTNIIHFHMEISLWCLSWHRLQ
jgi:hypothetical protein